MLIRILMQSSKKKKRVRRGRLLRRVLNFKKGALYLSFPGSVYSNECIFRIAKGPFDWVGALVRMQN